MFTIIELIFIKLNIKNLIIFTANKVEAIDYNYVRVHILEKYYLKYKNPSKQGEIHNTDLFFILTTGQICNSPLLQNKNTFPDSAFSGSGDSSNKYKDARITKGGWCPSGSGSAYLLLDLQKEYHITQVVVMADKEQTKWSGSYSMNFSVDTSYKNSAQVSIVFDCNEIFSWK
jgi:hypothetical protein